LKPYDIVPIIPIIERAGGVVSTLDGAPALDGGTVVAAATPQLHEAVLACLTATVAPWSSD
jgi:fructose-1,6-bisphosphatase/inositol monophosphatase family enzyme